MLLLQGAQVRSLVGELRFHMPKNAVQKKKKKKKKNHTHKEKAPRMYFMSGS